VKPFSIVLLLAVIVGIVIGPAQAIYCTFISGHEAGDYPFKSGQPITIPLTPDMSPVRFNAKLTYSQARRTLIRKTSRFNGKLSLDGSELWTQSFGVTKSKDKKKSKSGVTLRMNSSVTNTVSIHSFEVTKAGDYQFSATQTQSQINTEQMTLLVRRNVHTVNMPTAIAGFVLCIGGIIVAFIRIIFSGKRSPAEPMAV